MEKNNNIAVVRVVKNTFFLYVLTFSRYFIGLLLFPYISRVLSVEGFGLIGFSMTYVLVFQVLVEFGFMISATGAIAKNREDEKKVSGIVSATMYAKILLTIVSILFFVISAYFIPIVKENLVIVSLFLVSSLISALVPDFLFRGVEKMKLITTRTVIVRLMTLLFVILFVKSEEHIILIPVAFILSSILALVIAFFEMRRLNVRIIRVDLSDAFKSIKESAMFFISRVSVSISQSSGAILIGMKYAPASLEAGLFSGASKVSSSSEMMLAPLSDSLYPHMINKRDYKLFIRIVSIFGFLWFIACLMVFIFAKNICGLVLGSDYYAAGDLLRVLIFGNFIAFFSNMFGYNALVPINKANHANIAIIVGAAFNVLGCATLWAMDSINLLSVCVIIASTNFVIFSYRACVYWKNRHLVSIYKNV